MFKCSTLKGKKFRKPPIFVAMANEALESVWIRVRDELRKQRGANRLRGSEVHLLPKRQVRIPIEARKSKLNRSEMVIHLSEVEADLWALVEPDGKRFHIKDYSHSLPEFITALVDECRGEAYLHTNSKRANYRSKENEI